MYHIDLNKHPLAHCDLHRLIDARFAASTFAKHVGPFMKLSDDEADELLFYRLSMNLESCLSPVPVSLSF